MHYANRVRDPAFQVPEKKKRHLNPLYQYRIMPFPQSISISSTYDTLRDVLNVLRCLLLYYFVQSSMLTTLLNDYIFFMIIVHPMKVIHQ